MAILIWCAANGGAFANSSLTTKVSRIDGLPARLLKMEGIDLIMKSDAKTVDLAPALSALGCSLEEGESIIYHAASGSLIRNLSENNHELVDRIVDGLYRTDNLLASMRAYLDLMEPLSGDERLKALKRVGFLPDALVASMAIETSLAEGVEDRQELNRKTLELLNIALDRMKRQIAVMESPRTEVGAGQAAAAPESKPEGKKATKPATKSIPR